MHIARFKVERYRSIEKAESIDLATLTVLVGPNNEGKSNILRALVVGLQALSTVTAWTRTTRPRQGILRQRLGQFESYAWTRDFPIRLQKLTPGASSIFEFEFSLDNDDLAAFKKEIGHSLNGELKLRVLLANNGQAQIKIVKKGPGSAGLNANVQSIARFVSRRIRVEYIPVARTYDVSQMVVRREAESILQRVTQTERYQAALEELNRSVIEALVPLEVRLLEGVKEFVPEVTSVSLRVDGFDFRTRLPDVEIDIDDGQPTSLSAKGDGVQSLVAISLVRMLARENPDVTYILAVEEPEAHLHPGAVRKLRAVLDDIAENDQVILTTHSPILVRRDEPTSNILVNNNTAAPAKSLKVVRESLGIRLPDNMTSAEVVLLVEGKHDRNVVGHLLRTADLRLANALNEGRLEIRGSGGASNMPYQYRLFRDSACAVHVLLDDDAQGRRARLALEREEGIIARDVTIVSANGMNESELEDLFDPVVYSDSVCVAYNVSFVSSATHAEKRFSLRMRDFFTASGQTWSDSVEGNVKALVSESITKLPVSPVIDARRGVVDALVAAILSKLRM